MKSTSRRFPPPWSVEGTDACFIVRDANGQALAYVYFEDEPGRRAAAKLPSTYCAVTLPTSPLLFCMLIKCPSICRIGPIFIGVLLLPRCSLFGVDGVSFHLPLIRIAALVSKQYGHLDSFLLTSHAL